MFYSPLFQDKIKRKHSSKGLLGFPGGSDGKESTCNAGDQDSILGQERSRGEGKGYPLQYSCLQNSMDRGAWWATVHWGYKESERLILSLSKSLISLLTNCGTF